MATQGRHSVLQLFILSFCASVISCTLEVTIGLQILNYSIPQGALASGQCCDDPSHSPPHCTPDQCDVTFDVCGQSVPDYCDAFPFLRTPAFFNQNSLVIGSTMGNGNMTSPSMIVVKGPYTPRVINFTIFARDLSHTGLDLDRDNKTAGLIAYWNFTIDWLHLVFDGINPPWHDYLLRDTHAEIGLRALSMCSKYYYGPTCSKYCMAGERYTCLNDGSKKCQVGWSGPDCDVIDHCVTHHCQNGGWCVNNQSGPTCMCQSNYTGQFCETPAGIDSPVTITRNSTRTPANKPNDSTFSTSHKLTTTPTTMSTAKELVSVTPPPRPAMKWKRTTEADGKVLVAELGWVRFFLGKNKDRKVDWPWKTLSRLFRSALSDQDSNKNT